ncbi:site-specific integrase [Streptomyces mirabilis]|uniref:site-specific integrase n=1 Tax=Streptomyces mirabilis TaxID=68239 RepID=UPI0036518D50
MTAVEIVDAELVDDEDRALPVLAERPPAFRPVVDRHTMLRPGQAVPTEADAPTYSEADFRISQETADQLDDAPPANTSRTYGSAEGQFRDWCARQGRVAVPCTTATFVEYVAHLIREDKSPSTIQVAMSAIRSVHPDDKQPGRREARQLVQKHSRERARRKTTRKAPPIRSAALSAMVATCTAVDPPEQPKALRDAALLTVGWGMLSRRSELANLLIEQLTVEDDGVTVHVAFSKTDQAAAGEDTFIPADPDDPAVCPVVCARAWLEELRRQGITSGPLFRQITRGGNVRPRSGPRGDFLSPDAIGDVVKARAELAGLPDPSNVTAHGLRRGPAQEISEAGGDPTAQGRWKPGSNTVQKHYVEPARDKASNPLHAVRAKARAQGNS